MSGVARYTIGAAVELKTDSKWVEERPETNPVGVPGYIISIEESDQYGPPIMVKWSDGTRNCYHEEDLILLATKQPSSPGQDEGKLCPQCHDTKTYDGAKALDLVKRMVR